LLGLACRASTERRADTPVAQTASPAAAVAGAPSAAPGTARRPTVLFIGTSLTAGLGLDPDSAYPALLARRSDSLGLRFDFVNAGLSGETSAGALRRLDWLMRDPAMVVVVETGANDGLRGLDVDSTRANLRAIVRKVKAAHPAARIVLAQMEAPPNLGEKYAGAFHRMFQEVASEEAVGLIPFLLTGVAGDARLNQPDGIHPNERGERIVADNVWKTLGPVLEALDRTAASR
jgi:acyl-CoA thioesterase-1